MGLRSSGSTGSALPRAISPGAFGSFVGVGMCMCLGTLTGVGSDFHLSGAGSLLFPATKYSRKAGLRAPREILALPPIFQ